MAVCKRCNREMLGASTCIMGTISVEGKQYTRIRAGNGELDRYQRETGGRCGDCGVPPGGLHHRFCCKEACPKCGDQLVCCGCWDQAAEGGGARVVTFPRGRCRAD